MWLGSGTCVCVGGCVWRRAGCALVVQRACACRSPGVSGVVGGVPGALRLQATVGVDVNVQGLSLKICGKNWLSRN